MATKEEVDKRLQELQTQEQELNNISNENIPVARYRSGYDISKQRKDIIKRKEQAQKYISDLYEERKQLIQYKKEIQDYEKKQKAYESQKSEYESEKADYEQAVYLIRSGRAYLGRGRVKRFIDDLQAGGMVSSEGLVQQRQALRNYEKELKKPELVLSEGAYADFTKRGLIPEGRKVSVVSYKIIEEPTINYVQDIQMEEPVKYSFKDISLKKTFFPSSKKEDYAKEKGITIAEYVDQKYLDTLNLISEKTKKAIPDTEYLKPVKTVLFDYKIKVIPSFPTSLSEVAKFGFFSPAMTTRTQYLSDKLIKKEIEPTKYTEAYAEIQKVGKKKYDITLISKTDIGKDILIKDSGIRTVQYSKQTAFDLPKNIVKGKGMGINMLEISKGKYQTDLFIEKGFTRQLAKAKYVKTSKLPSDILVDQFKKGKLYASGSKTANILKVNEIKVPTSTGFKSKLIFENVKSKEELERVIGILTKSGKRTYIYRGTTQKVINFGDVAVIPKEDLEVFARIKYVKSKGFDFKISAKQPVIVDKIVDISPRFSQSPLALKAISRVKTANIPKAQSFIPKDKNLQFLISGSRTAGLKSFEKELSKQLMSTNKAYSSKTMVSSLALTKGLPKQNTTLKEKEVYGSRYNQVESLRSIESQKLRLNQIQDHSLKQRLNQRQRDLQMQRQGLRLRMDFKIPKLRSREVQVLIPKIQTPIRSPKIPGFIPDLKFKKLSSLNKISKTKYEVFTYAPDITSRIANIRKIIPRRSLAKELRKYSSGLGLKPIPIIK